MREFAMGAAVPATLFDPMLTIGIFTVIWLGFGMLFATISLLTQRDMFNERPTSTIIAAWCLVSILSPGVMLWKMVKPSDKGDK